MKYQIANPDPAGTIDSFKSLGYTVEAAVADLIDNSITAQARQVNVEVSWEGRNSWIAIVDDGIGMSEVELVTAMTVAAKGPGIPRGPKDLGRFGMGLKTASFSQARQLFVTTARSGGPRVTRAWDLDVVKRTGEWRLLQEVGPSDATILDRLWTGHGTVVLWRGLHRFDIDGITASDTAAKGHFYDEIANRVEPHLGMVFSRFLDGRRLNLTLHGNPVQSWDPFLTNHEYLQALYVESIPIASYTMHIAGYVLPHTRYLGEQEVQKAAGPHGWLDQQGFYVYRRDRLIVAGDWLGIKGFRKEDKYILARIAVDIPAELDSEWSIDVRKSATVPPVAARPHLRRIGEETRRRAAAVLSHRGRIATIQHGADFVYAWKVQQRDGQVTCKINRKHPLVQQVLNASPAESAAAKALLRLLEETVPITALRVMHEAETIDSPEPFSIPGGAADEGATAVAEQIRAAYLAQGITEHEARTRIRLMPPFDQMPGFWQDQ